MNAEQKTSQKKREVFILGAGFSKAIHDAFPLTDELGKDIISKLSEEHRGYLKNINPKIQANLENLMSFLISDLPWKGVAESFIEKGLFHAISREISTYFLNLHKSISSENNNVAKLISYAHQNEAKILSFNYDLLIENQATASEKRLFFNFDGHLASGDMSYSGAWTLSFEIKFHLDIQNSGVIFDIQTPGDITEEAFLRQFYADAEVNGLIKERLQPKDYESLGNRIYKELKEFKRNQKIRYHDLYQMPLTHIGVRHGMTYWSVVEYTRLHLLKLHGSINWFYSGKTQFPGEQLYYAEGLAELNEYQTKTDLVPFIIPPVLDKGEFYQHNAIRQIWETAGSHL